MTCPHQKRFQHLGTVSHGTARYQDLIPAFLDVLRQIDPASAANFDGLDLDSMTPEAGDQFVDEIMDTLDVVAPYGLYFGAHEGDGSDYGFWFRGQDVIDEAIELDPDSVGQELPEDNHNRTTSDFFLVNERGNVSYYIWCGSCREWVEIYGIV